MILLQAIPTIEISKQWDVKSKPIKDVFYGDNRADFNELSNLRTFNLLKPIVNGIRGVDQDRHITEIHRTGYISSLFIFRKDPDAPVPDSPVFFGENAKDLFKAFFSICSDMIALTESDYPFLLCCKILKGNPAFLFHPNLERRKRYFGPLGKHEEIFPDQIRQNDDDFENIANEWEEALYNAFEQWAPK